MLKRGAKVVDQNNGSGRYMWLGAAADKVDVVYVGVRINGNVLMWS